MEKTPFENKFFDRLLEETFDHQNKELQPKQELEGEFLVQVEQFIQRNEDSQINLSYRPSSGCYRVMVNNETLDFPKNWSIFSKLHQAGNSGEDFFCLLSEKDDSDHVLEILSQLLQTDIDGIILVKKRKAFMVPILRRDPASYFLLSEIRE